MDNTTQEQKKAQQADTTQAMPTVASTTEATQVMAVDRATQDSPVVPPASSAAQAALHIGAAPEDALTDVASDPNAKKRVIALVGMAVAVVIIAVSAFLLFSPQSFSSTLFGSDIAEEQLSGEGAAGESVTNESKNDGDESADSEDDNAADKGNDGKSQKDDSSQTDKKDDVSADGQNAGNSDGQDDANASNTETSTGSSQGNSDNSSDTPGSQDALTPPPSNPSQINVSLVVSSAAVGNPVGTSQSLVLSRGATVYDALLASGLSINATSSSMGIYVAGINGLAEKQHGAMSGWTYYVNGVWADRSCGYWTLNDGDQIYWEYVTSVENW